MAHEKRIFVAKFGNNNAVHTIFPAQCGRIFYRFRGNDRYDRWWVNGTGNPGLPDRIGPGYRNCNGDMAAGALGRENSAIRFCMAEPVGIRLGRFERVFAAQKKHRKMLEPFGASE